MVTVDMPFCGKLTVELVVAAEVYSAQKDYRLYPDSTLIEYIGGAAANHFTNFRQVSITIDPSEWRILEFSPEQKLLRAEYIGEEDITDLPDDSELLSDVFGIEPLGGLPEDSEHPRLVIN